MRSTNQSQDEATSASSDSELSEDQLTEDLSLAAPPADKKQTREDYERWYADMKKRQLEAGSKIRDMVAFIRNPACATDDRILELASEVEVWPMTSGEIKQKCNEAMITAGFLDAQTEELDEDFISSSADRFLNFLNIICQHLAWLVLYFKAVGLKPKYFEVPELDDLVEAYCDQCETDDENDVVIVDEDSVDEESTSEEEAISPAARMSAPGLVEGHIRERNEEESTSNSYYSSSSSELSQQIKEDIQSLQEERKKNLVEEIERLFADDSDYLTSHIAVHEHRLWLRTQLIWECKAASMFATAVNKLNVYGMRAQIHHETKSGSRWFCYGPLFRPTCRFKKITDELYGKYTNPRSR